MEKQVMKKVKKKKNDRKYYDGKIFLFIHKQRCTRLKHTFSKKEILKRSTLVGNLCLISLKKRQPNISKMSFE